MKFPLSWLARHIDTAADPDEIARRLTDLGLEVEDLHDPAALFAPFRVAAVTAARPHPEADRLQICTLRTADGEQEVVCGAPNARAGIRAVFAPEGATIPATGTVLKRAKIRGVESRGMLVSMAEMGLSDEAAGIIELPETVPVGTPMAAAMELDDPVFDIALTPNRGDCAGVRSIARDLAAAGLGALRPLEARPAPVAIDAPAFRVAVEDAALCPLFCAREIRGVANGPSPDWLQRLLIAAGARPVSALVDITNFLTLDRAQPLHAYDADALKGDTITVRAAREGESLTALDEATYALTGGEIAVCDDSGVIGLGGIIGGAATGCTQGTTRIVLEAAVFDPIAIARAGRALGIASDARYRFERRVDAHATREGLEAATRMILEVCGGEAGPIVQAGAPAPAPAAIRLDPAFTERLTGLRIDAARQADILGALGFAVEGQNVTPPPWRHDIAGPADLAEEIARVAGYDAIPTTPLPRAEPAALDEGRSGAARRALVARGLDECVTPSFVDGALAPDFGADQPELDLENPIAAELGRLRPCPLPHLIAAAAASGARGHPDAALCEVGPVFFGAEPGDQETAAAIVRTGNATPRHWSGPARAVDAFDAKADALAVLEACGMRPESVQITRQGLPAAYHPGRAGTLRQGKTVLGHFGELHPTTAQAMGLKVPAAMAVVFLDRAPEPRARKRAPLALPELQPVRRDFAFVVDAGVEAATLARVAARAEPKLIDRVEIFDVYEGLADNKKSVALCVTLQPRGKDALTDDALSAAADKITAAAEKATGATLRA